MQFLSKKGSANLERKKIIFLLIIIFLIIILPIIGFKAIMSIKTKQAREVAENYFENKYPGDMRFIEVKRAPFPDILIDGANNFHVIFSHKDDPNLKFTVIVYFDNTLPEEHQDRSNYFITISSSDFLNENNIDVEAERILSYFKKIKENKYSPKYITFTYKKNLENKEKVYIEFYDSSWQRISSINEIIFKINEVLKS